MSNNYSSSDISKIQNTFTFFDKDKRNYLTCDDTLNLIIALGGNVTNKESDIINEKSNSNKNKFSLDECVECCSICKVNINEISNKLWNGFKLWEDDKEGFVNKKIIESLWKNQNKLDDNEIEKIIKEAHPNENGDINYKNFTEDILSEIPIDESESNTII